MVYSKSVSGTHNDHDKTPRRRYQVVYIQKTEERRIFMEELSQYRNKRYQSYMNQIIETIGPKWYHALGVNQLCALDRLEDSLYRDILENRPSKTKNVLNMIGLHPPPKTTDIMAALKRGDCDGMSTLAYLFRIMCGGDFTDKRSTYSLNAKLILSSLFYVGLEDLIRYLEDAFKSDKVEPPPKPKKKLKITPKPVSPYLEKTKSVKCYSPYIKKRKEPLPLPDISEKVANVKRKIPPIPPPPPPPALRQPKPSKPRDHCDAMTGVMRFQPIKPVPVTPFKPFSNRKRGRRLSRVDKNKIDTKSFSVKKESKKPKAPHTPFEPLQYTIVGVINIREKPYFILGSVVNIPVINGYVHTGGHCMVQGQYERLHCGVVNAGQKQSEPCDCMKTWGTSVFSHLAASKCRCNHFYDCYQHKVGSFPDDELPYFEKPTRKSPFRFDYARIYELDNAAIYLGKEFNRIFKSDSMLNSEPGGVKTKKKKKPGAVEYDSQSCLGSNPKPKDYLRCILEVNETNMASRLPDVHLAPELREWMRRRMYGDITKQQKRAMLIRSEQLWLAMMRAEVEGLSHMGLPGDPALFTGSTTWANKRALRQRYNEYVKKYVRTLYTLQVRANNMLWATMFHYQFPDKKFRQIFFSYLLETMQDFKLIHPYDHTEVSERARVLEKMRIRKCVTYA